MYSNYLSFFKSEGCSLEIIHKFEFKAGLWENIIPFYASSWACNPLVAQRREHLGRRLAKLIHSPKVEVQST